MRSFCLLLQLRARMLMPRSSAVQRCPFGCRFGSAPARVVRLPRLSRCSAAAEASGCTVAALHTRALVAQAPAAAAVQRQPRSIGSRLREGSVPALARRGSAGATLLLSFTLSCSDKPRLYFRIIFGHRSHATIVPSAALPICLNPVLLDMRRGGSAAVLPMPKAASLGATTTESC